MNSSTPISIIAAQFVTYSGLICFIVGFVSNLLNFLVFQSLTLFRRNPSAFYLSVESIFNCLVLVIFYVPGIVENISQYDPWSSSIVFCKIVGALNPTFLMLSLTTVCFSSMDQYFSTNHRAWLRRISTVRLGQYLTLINVIIWTAHAVPFVVYQEIDPLAGCQLNKKSLQIYYSIGYLLLLNGVIPLLVSGSFSVLAFYSVRHLIRRQLPIVRRRLDRQLTAMVLTRVAFLFIVSIPFGVSLLLMQHIVRGESVSSETMETNLILAVTGTIFSLNYAVSSSCWTSMSDDGLYPFAGLLHLVLCHITPIS